MFSCELMAEAAICRPPMIRLFHQWHPVALLLAITTLAATAAPWVAPMEKVPPFRRDRLPIPVEAMHSLGNHLLALALAEPMESPERRRAVAQAIALVGALNPENETLQSLLSVLPDGREWIPPNPHRVAQAKESITRMHAWLSAAESGADANLLANLMAESISILDTQHPAARNFSKPESLAESPAESAGRPDPWAGWVAPISAFQVQPAEEIIPPQLQAIEVDDPFEFLESPQQAPPGPKPPAPEVKLTTAAISTVFQLFDEKRDRWIAQPVDLTMNAADGDFQLLIPGTEKNQWLTEDGLINPVENGLTEAFGVTPTRGQMELVFDSKSGYSFQQNQASMSGPVWLLAHAALSGIEPEGLFIAELTENQQWILPAFFWRMIMALAESETGGGRLVVPVSAEAPLRNLLALQHPDFFLRYEVLVASSADEFVQLTKKQRTEEQIAVSEKFREINERAGDSSLGLYLANRFVLQRLKDITAQAPYHLSAKLLAKQGSGTWPRFMTREAIAAELWRRIEMLPLPLGTNPRKISAQDIAQLQAFSDRIPEDIKFVGTYAESDDISLVKEANKLAEATRDLLSVLQDSRREWQKYNDIKQGQRRLRKEYFKLCKRLAEVSGDPIR